MSFFYNEKKGKMKTGKLVWLVLLAIVVIPLLTLGGKILFAPVAIATHTVDESINAAKEVVSIVVDGKNIILNYEYFYNSYNDILATVGKVSDANEAYDVLMVGYPDNSDDWSFTQRKIWETRNERRNSLKAVLRDQVSDYNARSSMLTRNIFKGWDLPDALDVDVLLGGI